MTRVALPRRTPETGPGRLTPLLALLMFACSDSPTTPPHHEVPVAVAGAVVSFTAPTQVSTLQFQLTVRGPGGTSPPDTVHVHVMVHPERAYFVSPLGDDAAIGSRAAPLQTIHAAMARAGSGPVPAGVYVAAGSYEGPRLDLLDGVSVYGGFEAQRWTRWSAADSVRLVAADSIAVLGDSVANVVLDGLVLVALGGGGASTSTYAVVLRRSRLVAVSRSVIVAGDGAAGANGARQDVARLAEPARAGAPGRWARGAGAARVVMAARGGPVVVPVAARP